MPDIVAGNSPAPCHNLTNGLTYNLASQIVSLTQSNTDYNYTAAENRTGVYEPNGLNQYDKVDGQTLEYDPTGNLTQDRASDGTLTTYTYDMENHLVAVDGEKDGTLRYDVLGRLAKLVTTVDGTSTTTLFHYDGDALVGEYRSGAVYRRYVHGDQVDEPLIEYQGANLATRRYLHADHQGSIIAHSTTLGAVTQKNAYDPYGIPDPDNAGRFGYTGQAWIPELGLNYYKARVYSPKLGRFLQTDPIFYRDDMNLYAYVGNDPIARRDPTGKVCRTLNGKDECTFDAFKDRRGNAISREQAMATGNKFTRALKMDRGSKIARAEAAMTAKYTGAKNLAANGGQVTIKGDKKLGIADETVSGSTIVERMEKTQTVASAESNANASASTPSSFLFNSSPGPITFFSDGATSQNLGRTFGHEILHTIYSGNCLKNGGWANPEYNNQHRGPFNDASDDIQ